MNELLFEQIKKDLNSSKIIFFIDPDYFEPLVNKIMVKLESNSPYDAYVFSNYKLFLDEIYINGLNKRYTYYIKSTTDTFNVFSFIKEFEIDINNTNIKSFISWINEMKRHVDYLDKCINDLPLEFL